MKIKGKLFGFITFFMVIMCLMVGCDVLSGNNDSDNNGGNNGGNSGGATNPTITIRNNTGYTLQGSVSTNGLYIKPSTSSDWGSNIANSSGYTINNTEERVFTLPTRITNNSVYDIRWISSFGTFIKYNITLSFGMTLTFNQSDFVDSSQNRNLTIKNLSGINCNSCFIKPSSALDWGIDFGSINNNSERIIILPFSSNFNVYDIQMRSSNPDNTYTKNNVSISNGDTIIFYATNSDNPQILNRVIVIENNTGYTLQGSVSTNGLYIKPSTSSDWGSNIANSSGYTINNTEARAFTLPVGIMNNNVYDIRWRSSSGIFVKYNVSLSFGMVLTFNIKDLE